VHHAIDRLLGEDPIQFGGVADIHLPFREIRMVVLVRTNVDADTTIFGIEYFSLQHATEEAGPSGYKYSFHVKFTKLKYPSYFIGVDATHFEAGSSVH
jgi:hypothetical protein